MENMELTLSVFGVGLPPSSVRRDGQGASGSPRRRSKTPCGRSVDVAVAERLQFARFSSARCSVARSLCTTWRRAIPMHDLASRGLSAPHSVTRFLCTLLSRGPSARRDVARTLCTTWHRMVYLHVVASHGPSAPRSVARSFCTTWRRAVPLHAVVSCSPSAPRGIAWSLCTA